MKRLLIFLGFICFSYIQSQAYQLEYKCKGGFNDINYDFIQKFDYEKYYYSVKKHKEGYGSNPNKVYSANIFLDPKTLSYEVAQFPDGKDYFLDNLQWYNAIIKDATFKMDVILTSKFKSGKGSITYNSKSKQINTQEYILQNNEKTKDVYKVFFIEEDLIPIPMIYSKNNLLSEWATLFYAYKNSKMKNTIYSFEELETTHPLKCQLYNIHEITKF